MGFRAMSAGDGCYCWGLLHEWFRCFLARASGSPRAKPRARPRSRASWRCMILARAKHERRREEDDWEETFLPSDGHPVSPPICWLPTCLILFHLSPAYIIVHYEHNRTLPSSDCWKDDSKFFPLPCLRDSHSPRKEKYRCICTL